MNAVHIAEALLAVRLVVQLCVLELRQEAVFKDIDLVVVVGCPVVNRAVPVIADLQHGVTRQCPLNAKIPRLRIGHANVGVDALHRHTAVDEREVRQRRILREGYRVEGIGRQTPPVAQRAGSECPCRAAGIPGQCEGLVIEQSLSRRCIPVELVWLGEVAQSKSCADRRSAIAENSGEGSSLLGPRAPVQRELRLRGLIEAMEWPRVQYELWTEVTAESSWLE